MQKFDISELQKKIDAIRDIIYTIKDDKEDSLFEILQLEIDKANIQVDNLTQLKLILGNNLTILHNSLNLTSQELSSLIETKVPLIAGELYNIKQEGVLLENNLDDLLSLYETQVQTPLNLLESDIQKLLDFVGTNL